MEQTQGLGEESKLENEKVIKYMGTARIKLEWLHFQERELDFKHIQELKSCFHKDCRRLDVRNHVPAIIDQQHLDAALRLSGISEAGLPKSSRYEFPELGFWNGYRLICLHGRQRIEAAKLALSPPSNKWWPVDLYLADISHELRTVLTEEYANEGKPSDGQIYRKIRNYQFQKQSSLEMRWWTRLSSHGARNLKQLLQHRELTLAFDAFLEIPALLIGMRISTLHKMFAIRCDEEIVHYLRYIKQFWSDLLQQDKTAMAKVDQVTVEALQLTAPWASTLDAKILRGKVLGGEIFCRFSQQEREGIWIRLQSFKGLVPSLFEFFENVKCLEAWADCLKWLVCLGPRETLSTAMNKIYTGINQSVDSALVQENEITFKSVPASSARRIDLGYRQLHAFAMRYHCEMPRKPSGKDLLAKPRAMLDTTRLREMADLANRLGFESPEITALKQFSKSADPTIVGGNERPALVTDGPGEIRKDRCGMPHVQNYEEDRKFLFITHLYDDRDEQSEGITSYFRLRSTYLKFYGMPDDSNPQQHLTTVTGESLSPAFPLTRSVYSSREDQTRGTEHREVDGEHTEDTMMQEGEGEEQRPPFQAEGALAQEVTMQRQKLLSDAGVLEKKEHEQEQYRQKLAEDANAIVEEEQRLEQKRQKLLSDASTLEKQEQEQEIYRQKLVWDAGAIRKQEQEQEQRQQKHLSHVNIIEKQEQEQEQYRQMLIRDASVFKQQDQEPEQQRQKLLSDVSTLEKQEQEYRQKLIGDADTLREQEQEQEQQRQKLLSVVSALKEQEQEQERRKQKLISNASALKEREQEQEQMYQKLTGDANTLREQEQGQEEQRQTLAREENELRNRKQKQEEQRQPLAMIAGELVNQEQRQEEKRQKLTEYANNLKDQELRQNERRQKLTADISELNKQEKRHKKLKRDKLKQKREQKSVEQKVLRSKQGELETIQERDERDMGELQRQSQEELADLELPSPLELEHGGIYAGQITPEVQAENYSMDAAQKGGTQVDVSAPEGEDIPAQEHGLQQDRTQAKGQEERQTEETQGDRLHEPEAQEMGQEHGVQEREHEHQTQEDGQEGRAHGDGAHEDGVDENGAYKDAAHNDKAQGGRQAEEAQEVVQEDKAHKEGQDSGAHEDDIREYRARKRRVMTNESDDDAALRAQQLREGRKPVEKGKYQRLNRFGLSSHDTNREDDTSMDDTGEEDTTSMSRKKPQTPRRQQRQDLQAQQRTTNATAAVMTETTNGSTGLASDFTYEAPSRAT